MELFGALHLGMLLAIGLVAWLLIRLIRRGVLPGKAVCAVLGIALAGNEIAWWIWRYSREGVHVGNLPFQLCDAAVWISILACLIRAPLLAEFTYFAGSAGAGMALLTPDFAAPWPEWPAIYFMLAHGGIVLAAMLMAFSGVVRFEPRSVLRPFGLLLGYAAFAGTIDWVLGTNYMYLCSKPGGASALDRMGPWPWYLAGGAAFGLALFWLLWLPVRPRVILESELP